jgi:hypothetical protein
MVQRCVIIRIFNYFRKCTDKVINLNENGFRQNNYVYVNKHKESPMKNAYYYFSNEDDERIQRSSSLNRKMNSDLIYKKTEFKNELSLSKYSKSPKNNFYMSNTKNFSFKLEDNNSKFNKLKSEILSKKKINPKK